MCNPFYIGLYYNDRKTLWNRMGSAGLLCLVLPLLSSWQMQWRRLRRISRMFPQALITVGYIPWTTNPADALTKIFRDPIEIINSPI